MARRKQKEEKTKDLFNIQEQLSTAACVPAIREAVKVWRNGGYKGITGTTRELLNFWFYTDHILHNGNVCSAITRLNAKPLKPSYLFVFN